MTLPYPYLSKQPQKALSLPIGRHLHNCDTLLGVLYGKKEEQRPVFLPQEKGNSLSLDNALWASPFVSCPTPGGESDHYYLLLSAKLQNATISLSAMPINRRCGLLFGKVSPPFQLSFIGCPLKRENGRHEMWPNVFFKPLRALEYGEFY